MLNWLKQRLKQKCRHPYAREELNRVVLDGGWVYLNCPDCGETVMYSMTEEAWAKVKWQKCYATFKGGEK